LKSKRILLIHPEGNISFNPNLNDIVKVLCGNGYEVDIISLKRNHHQIAPCPGARFIFNDVDINKKNCVSDVACIPEQLAYDLLIGVDRAGIVDAFVLSQVLNIPYGLISYEIFFESETNKIFKSIEREACKRIAFAVCQDEVRAALLSKENQITDAKIIRIPVAGKSVRRGMRQQYLHQKLGISLDKKIAFFAGSIDSWTMMDEIIKTVPSWPENWVLVLHERYGKTKERVQKLLNNQKLDHVYFSEDSIEQYDGLKDMLFSIDLGIAFYQADNATIYTGKNIEYIGLASGKISTYLQHGVPVITNEIGLFSDYIRDYNLGLVVKEVNDVPDKLASMNQVNYTDRCYNFFEDKLDLTKTISPFLKVIDSLLTKPT